MIKDNKEYLVEDFGYAIVVPKVSNPWPSDTIDVIPIKSTINIENGCRNINSRSYQAININYENDHNLFPLEIRILQDIVRNVRPKILNLIKNSSKENRKKDNFEIFIHHVNGSAIIINLWQEDDVWVADVEQLKIKISSISKDKTLLKIKKIIEEIIFEERDERIKIS